MDQIQEGDDAATGQGGDSWTEVEIQRPQCEANLRPFGGAVIMVQGYGFACDDGYGNAEDENR